jgi:hypothetical protein
MSDTPIKLRGKGKVKVVSGEHSASVEHILSGMGGVLKKLNEWEPCRCKCGDVQEVDIQPILTAIKNINFPSCDARLVCDHAFPEIPSLEPILHAVNGIEFPEIPEVVIPPYPDYTEHFNLLKEHISARTDGYNAVFARLDVKLLQLAEMVDAIPEPIDWSREFQGLVEQINKIKNAVMAIEFPQPEKCKFPDNLNFSISAGTVETEPEKPKKEGWFKRLFK